MSWNHWIRTGFWVTIMALGTVGQGESPPLATQPLNTPKRLELPGGETWMVADRPAFAFLPAPEKRSNPQPWVFYAPTLPAYPDEAERWMHEQFLDAGVAVAGIDVGECYGSPTSHVVFDAFYDELLTKKGFSKKPVLFGRSRGGLWVSSWALAHPERVAGIIGIYPVYDFKTYPGLEKAAPAYKLTPEELNLQSKALNPVERIAELAKAKIPFVIIHGDEDKVVPLRENSAEVQRRYREAGAEDLIHLKVVPGQGHNFWEGFFHEQKLVDFAIARSKGNDWHP